MNFKEIKYRLNLVILCIVLCTICIILITTTTYVIELHKDEINKMTVTDLNEQETLFSWDSGLIGLLFISSGITLLFCSVIDRIQNRSINEMLVGVVMIVLGLLNINII